MIGHREVFLFTDFDMNTMKFDKNIASIPARTVSGSFVVSIAAAIIISLIIIAISIIIAPPGMA